MALVLERVLISDSVDPSCRQILEGGGVVVDYRPGLSKEELLVAIKVLQLSITVLLFSTNFRKRAGVFNNGPA